MQKGYVIGGLAVLGAIALISFYKKPKRNSEGFFGASGRMSSTKRVASQNCAYCKTSEGTVYHTGGDRNCSAGDRCITRYAFSKNVSM
jgi:hypothetical protein